MPTPVISRLKSQFKNYGTTPKSDLKSHRTNFRAKVSPIRNDSTPTRFNNLNMKPKNKYFSQVKTVNLSIDIREPKKKII